MLDKSEKLKTKLRRYIYTFKYKFFTKKVTVLKWQLNLFAISLLTIGLVVGSYASAAGIIKLVKALNETTYSIQHLGDTELTWGTGTNAVVTASNVTLDKNTNWFNLNWNYKKQLRVKNNSTGTVHSGSPITINLDLSLIHISEPTRPY